jgi:glycosyltransferase involved in cell wall biosynthesis
MPNSRICLVAPEFLGPFQNGGVGTSCYWEATTLGRAGFDVTVLYTGATERETPEHWERHYGAAGIFRYADLWRWARSTGADKRAAQIDGLGHEARVSQMVYEYLRAHDFDVLLFQEFLGHGARALQARESGVALGGTRAIVTLHSCRQWIFEGNGSLPTTREDAVVDFLERESGRLADRVIAPSRHMAEWIGDRWPLERTVEVIPNCYDGRITGPREPIDHQGPFTHLVFFGRLETRKGLHLFTRALSSSAVLREHVQRVTFLGRHSRVEERPSAEFLAEALAGMPWLQAEIRSDMGSLDALDWLAAQQNTLVVTPSRGDNLPYACVELHARRIPFVSTRTGGIPEIVGDANQHQLGNSDVPGLRAVLERVCVEGRLTIDYRCGYDAASANRHHVELVREVASQPQLHAGNNVAAEALTVVVADAVNGDDLLRTQTAFERAGATLPRGSRWCMPATWRATRGAGTSLFVSSSLVPRAGLVEALQAAVANPHAHAATSYYTRTTAAADVAAPLGASLELGWQWNCFGGPCFIARRETYATLDRIVDAGFGFWPAYAAMACAPFRLAMVPEPLYAVDGAAQISTKKDQMAVITDYSTNRAPIDLGWTLKTILPLISANAGRLESAPAEVRGRLVPVLDTWRQTQPRVFICGAGVHTQMLLTAFPELGHFVAGFIDRRPLGQLFGRPCVSPTEFCDDMADAILYSSREFERDMYAAMANARVEHVLLYSDAALSNEAAIGA